MIVTPDIEDVVTRPFPDTDAGKRLGEFRAWLDAFSEHGEISVCEDPYKKPPDAMLARVAPVEAEFWSIRITDPEDTPGIRALGAFAAKDTFVALIWDFRENIASFNEEVESVQEMWSDLFGTEPPFSGGSVDDYLSNYRIV